MNKFQTGDDATVIAEFGIQLLSDGTLRHVGYQQVTEDETARAVETIQAAMPGSRVVEDDEIDNWGRTPSLSELIKAAPDGDALATLWREHRESWTAEHNKLAAARKKEIAK